MPPPSTDGYDIRPARPSELARLGAIEKAAAQRFAEIGMAGLAENDGLSAEFLQSCCDAGAVFVAAQNGTPVAFAAASPLDRALHLYEIDVLPDHAGHRLGEKLIEALAHWGRAQGFRAVTLSTFADVPWNAPYYGKIGFKVVERAAWTPAFHLLYDHEINVGLDVSKRCFMRKDI